MDLVGGSGRHLSFEATLEGFVNLKEVAGGGICVTTHSRALFEFLPFFELAPNWAPDHECNQGMVSSQPQQPPNFTKKGLTARFFLVKKRVVRPQPHNPFF